jgi:hypothetical protein
MKLQLDRRIIFATVMILMAIPYIRPFALPLEIAQSTKDSYNTMQSIPDGSTIVYSIDIGVESLAEMQAGLTVATNYFVDRHFKLVFVAFYTDGPVIFGNYVKPILDTRGYVYGKDYVMLGYISGLAVGYQSMATNMRSVVKNDYYGAALDSLEMMKNVNAAKDVKMAFTIDAYNSVNDYLYYWASPYKVLLVGMPTGTCYMVYYPSYAGKLVQGLIGGARGIAEFELVVNKPGLAIASIGALTIVHLLLAFFMILGNVVYFTQRSKGGA